MSEHRKAEQASLHSRAKAPDCDLGHHHDEPDDARGVGGRHDVKIGSRVLRDANDLGQIIFALFVAVSITAATRAGTHLAADAVAQRYSPRLRVHIRQIGALVGLAPWALFILFASKSAVISSLQVREGFPDTGNPGYFIIKLALWIMAIIILAQSVLEIVPPAPRDDA